MARFALTIYPYSFGPIVGWNSGHTAFILPISRQRLQDVVELFLRKLLLDVPFRWSLLEGAKGIQLPGPTWSRPPSAPG